METELLTSQLTAPKFIRRFESKVRKTDTCWIWLASRATTGYGQMFVAMKGKRSNIVHKSHRIAWQIYVGPIPNGLQVLHNCDNRLCVKPDHLYLGTQQDNVNDMMKRGRNGYCRREGQQHPMAKLTDNQVGCIKHRLTIGISPKDLAKEFSVARSTIAEISRGATWRHI